MSDVVFAALIGAAVGGFLTGAVALISQVLAARSQAEAAREANRQQDRLWHRNERLNAHHAFLDQVNRLIGTIHEVQFPNPGANPHALMAELREGLARTVDAYNRVDLVSTEESNRLAVRVLEAADAKRLQDPRNFNQVVSEIVDALQAYRTQVKAELRALAADAGLPRIR